MLTIVRISDDVTGTQTLAVRTNPITDDMEYAFYIIWAMVVTLFLFFCFFEEPDCSCSYSFPCVVGLK